MKIAYLILAHDNPAHLLRLTRALSSESSSIFIHIDRKSNFADFVNAEGENVHLIRARIPVHWGDFSQVEAILIMLRMALSAREHYDYFVLLSGTDYPLRAVSYITSFFQRHSGQEFINIAPVGSQPGELSISRLTIYRARPSDPTIVRIVAKLARLASFPMKRDYKAVFGDLTPYYGSTWWALSWCACEYIQCFVKREPHVVEFFKHTRCPDEMFFQTILVNSPFRSKIRRNLTYTDWSAGGSSPADLTESHLEHFRSHWPVTLNDYCGSGEALFARKFSDLRPDITVAIDTIVTEHELAAVGLR